MANLTTKIKNDNGQYELTFTTSSYDEFRRVQQMCREIIDGQPTNELSEDAISLLQLFKQTQLDSYIPEYCRCCPNHPSNGGSGICNCTLGLPQVTC